MIDESPHKISKLATLFPASRFANARILIVDDSPMNLKVITSRLEAAGYKNIETAADGIEGLKKTAAFRPDIVLLDIMMPNMDGFTYCEMVRADSTMDPMPIIVQTALDDKASMLRALSCGADDFLKKPLDLEEVNLRVYVHLKRYFMYQDASKATNGNAYSDTSRESSFTPQKSAPTEGASPAAS